MGFIINSDNLVKLQKRFEDAASIIKNAINDKRPIWIRHHNDCDGYCAALSLERVILKKLHDFHIKQSDVFFFYKRFPTRTPFYDYSDATRDISLALSDKERFNRKSPLLLIVDNGSTNEDILALKKLKVYDIETVVVDHHPNDKKVDKYLAAHINPHLIGADSGITAAMLCAELAKIIDDNIEGIELLAATGGIADKSDAAELAEYINLAKGKGFNREYLTKLAEVVDFEANQLLNLEGRQYVQDLLFGDFEKQKAIVDIVKDKLEYEKNSALDIISNYIEYEDLGEYIVAFIDTDSYFNLKGMYYTKITGLAKEMLEKKLAKPVAVVGYGSQILTLRAEKSLNFDIHQLLSILKTNFPYSMLQGGGHPNAGSIHFASYEKNNIIKKTKEYLGCKNV
ncbi:MAG: DHH family phosphoesterase [Nanobdellota archaeon]